MDIRSIQVTSRFQKSFSKLSVNVQREAVNKKSVFQKNPFDQGLRTHKLKGRLANLWSFSVNRSYRIVFSFKSKDTALFYDIGDHRIYR